MSPNFRMLMKGLSVVALAGFIPIGIPILLVLVHDPIGRLNTRYAAGYSAKVFENITIGTPRTAVIERLGAPVRAGFSPNNFVWAFRTDTATRQRYGPNSLIEVEVLSYSASRGSGDYEVAYVVVGPDGTVIETDKWVTD